MKKTTFFVLCLQLIGFVNINAQTTTKIPVGKMFYIQSALNYGKDYAGYWDIPGSPDRIQSNANIQVYEMDDGHDRKFTFHESTIDGFYEIQIGNASDIRVDIDFGRADNGTNVKACDRNGNDAQKFRFQHLGSERFKIFDRKGKVLCLANRSSQNGSNVHIWDNHDGSWMEWYLVDVQTNTAFISGNNSINSSYVNSSYDMTIPENEKMVYAKVGLSDEGKVKYSFVIIRVPYPDKNQVYQREMQMPYGPQPILRGGQMRLEREVKPFDKYDYYVYFNGKEFGPYDRIYDMDQNDGDVDQWITPDGKYISFAGVKGQKYYPVFANEESQVYFWSVTQAPGYDPSSNKRVFAMQWAKDDVRLLENGSFVLEGWKVIAGIQYADNNRDLLYVGAKDNKNEQYIYLNHKPIAGPFSLISQYGFLPGTNKVYYKADKRETVDGKSITKRSFQIGDKKFDTSDEVLGRMEFAGPWISFKVTLENKDYTGTDADLKRNFEVWEYNYQTGVLKKHGNYIKALYILKSQDDKFYYSTYDTDKNCLFVLQGGQVLDKVSAEERENSVVAFRLSPNGDAYSFYHKGFGKPYTLKKNGKLFKIPGVEIIMGVEILKFNPKNGKLQMVVTKDQSVGSEDRTVINGENQYDIKGRAFGSRMFFAEEGEDVISLLEFKQPGDDKFTVQVYKNDKRISDLLLRSVVEFSISPDASRYAALVTEASDNVSTGPYYTENQFMDTKRKLMVDGKIVPGNFGAPIWSKERNKFLVFKQEGNKVRLVEL